MGKIIAVIADVSTAKQIDSAGDAVTSASAEFVNLFLYNTAVLSFNLRDSGTLTAAGLPSAFVIPPTATFQLSIDEDWLSSTAPLVRVNTPHDAAAIPAQVNYYTVNTDGSSVNFTARLSTPELITAMDGTESKSLKIQLRMAIGEELFTLLQSDILMKGDIDEPGTAEPTNNDPNYLTTTQTYSLLNPKLNKDFSGLDTKTALVDADTFAANDSAAAGNPIAVTALKIWNYICSKLHAVAVSGAYSDLSGTPDIPSDLSDLSDSSELIPVVKTVALTAATTTPIPLGAIASYGAWSLIVRIYNTAGETLTRNLLISADGVASDGPAAANPPPNLAGFSARVATGIMYLDVSLTAGDAATIKYKINSQF